jgi:hypothetical protein
MTDFSVSLSSAAIKSVVVNEIQEDCEFVLGGKGYTCASIRARVLSPRIRLSHSVDPSITEYVVETPNLNDEFHLFLSLGSGSTIPIAQSNRFFLFRYLGNLAIQTFMFRL